MESCRFICQLYRTRTFAGKPHIADCFYSLHTLWHSSQFIGRTITKPQAITRATIDKLLRTVPRLKILLRLWFHLDELFHFLFSKQIIATINRLVAYSNFGYIANWSISAFNKHVICI